MKRLLFLAFVAVIACDATLPAAPDDGETPDPPIPPVQPSEALRNRITLDGTVELQDFDVIRTATVDLRDGFGAGGSARTATVQWGVLNDERDIYLGFIWNDPTPNTEWTLTGGPLHSDGIGVAFDNDGDGTFELGEDQRTLISALQFSQFVDQHMTGTGAQTDLVQDGQGRLRYNAPEQQWEAEFLISLGDDTEGTDGSRTASSRVAFQILDGVKLAEGTGLLGGPFGAMSTGASTSEWPTLDLTDETTTPPAGVPSGLGGLIAFISHHTGSHEVYTFDPATRQVRQVTDAPHLFKDAVSLSNDRTRIAFHGGPSSTDFANFEIYTVNVDGSDLRAVTNNSLLDGHPAWAPDDSKLAYASFRDAGRASIVLMEPDGTELADLTPDGIDDNDPEFTPDGRILIKTTRFSPFPQYRMAVMNPDGTGVQELTHASGVSDHDATTDGQRVYFERFMRDTHFGDDLSALLDRWNLIAVGLDGTGEVTLLDDGWVNWLPVPDPAGRYLVYLKSVGYTEARLIDLDGVDHGRLIPGMTSIGYIDWK